MPEYIHLIGSEDVARAAHQMQDAAERMSRAASNIDTSLREALARFDEIVTRLESLRPGAEGERT